MGFALYNLSGEATTRSRHRHSTPQWHSKIVSRSLSSMDLQTNPFTALSLIAAPAVLTNSCSVLALNTSNRLARTVDRARQLTTELERETDLPSPLARATSQELADTQRRMLMLIRAMSAFYTAVGGFAASALISLLGAVFTPLATNWVARMIETVAICIGTIAVVALVRGALLLVRETRVAVRMLEERAVQAQKRFARSEEEADRSIN